MTLHSPVLPQHKPLSRDTAGEELFTYRGDNKNCTFTTLVANINSTIMIKYIHLVRHSLPGRCFRKRRIYDSNNRFLETLPGKERTGNLWMVYWPGFEVHTIPLINL